MDDGDKFKQFDYKNLKETIETKLNHTFDQSIKYIHE